MNDDRPWWIDWSTVIYKPGFWWRLKYLFHPHDLIFCWNKDKYFTTGFKGEWRFAIGGVPDSERHRGDKSTDQT